MELTVVGGENDDTLRPHLLALEGRDELADLLIREVHHRVLHTKKTAPAPHVRQPAFGGLWGAEGQWEEGDLSHVDLAGVHRLVVVDERREFLEVLLRHLQRLVHDAVGAHKRLLVSAASVHHGAQRVFFLRNNRGCIVWD